MSWFDISKPKIGNTEIFEKVKSSNILYEFTADKKGHTIRMGK
jgi:hypothetical protein